MSLFFYKEIYKKAELLADSARRMHNVSYFYYNLNVKFQIPHGHVYTCTYSLDEQGGKASKAHYQAGRGLV
jgi:hypothetical protein